MITVRLWFTKTGEAAYISLLDLQRVMQRAFKRSGLPAWYTLGFNPHIYMTFSAPLALGQESLCESLDFKSEAEDYDWNAGGAKLAACLPQGIEVVKLEPARMDPARIAYAVYEWLVAPEKAAAARAAFDRYNAAPQVLITKEGKRGKKKELDLKERLREILYKEQPEGLKAKVTLPAGGTLTLNPMLLVRWLCEDGALDPADIRILRTKLLTAEKEIFC